ncbi:phosphopantetheine-binding protein [Clostridium botulinum]|uniref:phosphopantetheine-binding protein n=1 Tax=Clostridium botulinum TaxID=1491 RepID=UPI0006A7565B|nr:phosphopantetheine-binding protein [Clostridium botulinum]MBY7002867.1 phosphopantetheine-binding protein [Clostridium botulinum]MCR1146678.1 phosphopantetheine-binding protein [Clostridium botulinum]NFH92451.1 phosphopantetheine-binding protein [Clostridium botulinum]NFH95742.1 phosphopantetheine-binding protein [Clostridium botulinum]NFI23866.1 phosphopantetheine-binding protein [Clostridium botulinum]
MIEKLRKIISENTFIEIKELEAISQDELLSNLGLDSINLIYVVGEIEREFEFTFAEEELVLENFETINKIVKLVEKHLKIKA